MTEPTKRCSHCKRRKPLSEFGKSTRSRDGLAFYCRSCNNADARKRMRRYRGIKRVSTIFIDVARELLPERTFDALLTEAKARQADYERRRNQV